MTKIRCVGNVRVPMTAIQVAKASIATTETCPMVCCDKAATPPASDLSVSTTDSKEVAAPSPILEEKSFDVKESDPRVAVAALKQFKADVETLDLLLVSLDKNLTSLEHALLLLCGDVEENPGPSEAKRRRAREFFKNSKILRKFIAKNREYAETRKTKKDPVLIKSFFPTYTGKGAYTPAKGVRLKRGRGGFLDWLGYIPRALGGGIGLLTGGADAARKGWETGAGISKTLGLGKYRMMRGRGAYETGGAAGSNVGGVTIAAPVPLMHSGEDHIRCVRREYLGDVFTSASAGAFSLTSFKINPAEFNFLPWGASIFSNFSEYEIVGMLFHFESSSSAYTTSTTLGTYTMSAEYDPAATDPANRLDMDLLSGSVTRKIDECSDFFFECDPKQTVLPHKFMRIGDQPANTDIRLYDSGKFYIATQGCAASVNIGSLYVSYDIMAYKPRNGSNATADFAHYAMDGVDTGHYFGLTRVKKSDTMGLTFTTSTVTIPAGTSGTFIFQWLVCDTSGTNVAPSHAYTTNCTAGPYFYPTASTASAAAYYSTPSSTTTHNVLCGSFKITNPALATVLTFSSGTITAGAIGDFILTEVNSTITA